jgi:hypothetical protein
VKFNFESPAARETEPTAPVPEHRWCVAGNHRARQRAMPQRAEFPDDCSQQQSRNAAALFHPHNENPIHIAGVWPRRPVQPAVPILVFEQGMARHLPPKPGIELEGSRSKEPVKRMLTHRCRQGAVAESQVSISGIHAGRFLTRRNARRAAAMKSSLRRVLRPFLMAEA